MNTAELAAAVASVIEPDARSYVPLTVLSAVVSKRAGAKFRTSDLARLLESAGVTVRVQRGHGVKQSTHVVGIRLAAGLDRKRVRLSA